MDLAWVKLELDLRGFDRPRFDGIVERVTGAGVGLTTLAAVGDTDANRRRLYELNARCSADIPHRGPFHTWEEYRRLRLDVDSFDPAGVVLAIDRDEWVGMSATSDHRGAGHAFNEMTGVERRHRRRGIAMAMKTVGIEYASQLGVPVVRTVHHPENTAMIALNRRLGYADADW